MNSRLMSKRNVETFLRQGVARRAIQLGWLKPKVKSTRLHLCDRAEVLAVQERILNGESPFPKSN